LPRVARVGLRRVVGRVHQLDVAGVAPLRQAADDHRVHLQQRPLSEPNRPKLAQTYLVELVREDFRPVGPRGARHDAGSGVEGRLQVGGVAESSPGGFAGGFRLQVDVDGLGKDLQRVVVGRGQDEVEIIVWEQMAAVTGQGINQND
jgi:hypothetical protein